MSDEMIINTNSEHQSGENGSNRQKNRKDMIKLLDNQSKAMAKAMRDAIEMMKRSGADVKTFGPGIMPSKIKS